MAVSSGGSRHQLSQQSHKQSKSTRALAAHDRLRGPRVPRPRGSEVSAGRSSLHSVRWKDGRGTTAEKTHGRARRAHHVDCSLSFSLALLGPAVRPLERREPARGAYGYIYCDPAEVRQSQQKKRGTPANSVSALFAFSGNAVWRARQTVARVFKIVFCSSFSTTIFQFIRTLSFDLPRALILRYEANLPKRQQIGGDKTGGLLVQQKDRQVVAARLRQLSVAGAAL